MSVQIIDRENGLPQEVPATSMTSMIERIVMDPSIPIDRLQQVLALKERMEDRAREDAERVAKKAYFSAMSLCQSELPIVTKTKKNTHTSSTYADLAAIEAQAMPIIHNHGFAVSFQPDGYNEKGELRILWEISHSEGHARSGVGGIPVDGAGSQGKVNKTGTQAFGSTATYGRRYLLCMLFNISTGDDDGNATAGGNDFIDSDEAETLRAMIEASGADVPRFLAYMKASDVTTIRAKDYDRAVAALQKKAAAK